MPALPPEFCAIPVHEGETPLRICAVVRKSADPVQGNLVLLRSTLDALVQLGCVTDASGSVLQWLEIWVQSVEGLQSSFTSGREGFSEDLLEQRWKQETELFAALEQGRFVHTGWENHRQPAFFLDLDQLKPVAEGDAPLDGARLVRWNPEGRCLRVLAFSPLAFDDYADWLGSASPAPSGNGKIPAVAALGIDRSELLDQKGAFFFGAVKSVSSRLPEIFHLKVQLLLNAVRKVRAVIERQQLPFLNISSESFRVALSPVGMGLPVHWTAEVNLVKTGNAHALTLGADAARYFIRARPGGESIYLPEGISRFVQGTGAVRLRKVSQEARGTVVEGTLVPEQAGKFSPNDLLWLRLPLPGGTVNLYGHLYAAESLASGEVRFATIPAKYETEILRALEAGQGASLPPAPFEVVPVLSSPCDLFSLGVLAVRALLVNDHNSLPLALDELLSLARECGGDPSRPLALRVAGLMRKDERFAKGLGPHRLLRDARQPEEAGPFLPESLWHELLAILARFFPGALGESYCKDFGDAPALALEVVFDRPIADLEQLLLRARSLIFIDWNANREINAVIQQVKKQIA